MIGYKNYGLNVINVTNNDDNGYFLVIFLHRAHSLFITLRKDLIKKHCI